METKSHSNMNQSNSPGLSHSSSEPDRSNSSGVPGLPNSSSAPVLSNSFGSSSSSGNDGTIKIALDIGHQKGNARGEEFLPPYKDKYKDEYDYWSQNIHKIVAKLNELVNVLPSGNPGIEIRIFNRGDYGNSLDAEVTAIEDWVPDIAASMHLNSYGDGGYTDPQGSETWFLPGNNDAALLGDKIRYYLTNLAYLGDRGNKPAVSGSRSSTWCRIPGATVLVEAGFVTNGHDCDILVNKTDSVTDSIALGIFYFMNVKGWIYIS